VKPHALVLQGFRHSIIEGHEVAPPAASAKHLGKHLRLIPAVYFPSAQKVNVLRSVRAFYLKKPIIADESIWRGSEAEEKATREARQRELDEQRKAKEAENAELRRVAELETAKREKAEAETRAANAEKAAKEKAERELQDRNRREKEEADKREANKKHQAKINNEAVAGLVEAGLSKDDAVKAITAIAKRAVQHVVISY